MITILRWSLRFSWQKRISRERENTKHVAFHQEQGQMNMNMMRWMEDKFSFFLDGDKLFLRLIGQAFH